MLDGERYERSGRLHLPPVSRSFLQAVSDCLESLAASAAAFTTSPVAVDTAQNVHSTAVKVAQRPSARNLGTDRLARLQTFNVRHVEQAWRRRTCFSRPRFQPTRALRSGAWTGLGARTRAHAHPAGHNTADGGAPSDVCTHISRRTRERVRVLVLVRVRVRVLVRGAPLRCSSPAAATRSWTLGGHRRARSPSPSARRLRPLLQVISRSFRRPSQTQPRLAISKNRPCIPPWLTGKRILWLLKHAGPLKASRLNYRSQRPFAAQPWAASLRSSTPMPRPRRRRLGDKPYAAAGTGLSGTAGDWTPPCRLGGRLQA
jgi:hypothetical protein